MAWSCLPNGWSRFVLLMLLLSSPAIRAEEPVARASAEMAKAAADFLAGLSPAQREQATFTLEDPERFNWHFVPRVRKGLPLKAMDPEQRKLAQGLLASGLSQRGYVSSLAIMSLEHILHEMQQGRGPVRDAKLYYFTIFGQPGAKATWGWRVEGHHLSLNFTLVEGTAVAAAPLFVGSNPAIVQQGPRKGERVQAQEEELGRAMVKSLTESQRATAIIAAQAPHDIITGNDRRVKLATRSGIRLDELTEVQKQLLLELIGLYAHRLRAELAEAELQRIEKAGVAGIHFAWAGGLEPGQGHYYRIHGPTFLIEYDNTQNNANHIHTVWRDLERDFGEDLLRRHYDRHRHGPHGDH